MKHQVHWPRPLSGQPPCIWFGGDYNPEQWDRSLWDEDIALMHRAKVSMVTVGVFSWSLLEPESGVFDFDWLEDIIERLGDAGIAVDLATATASPPNWLSFAHPEILPMSKELVVQWPGSRQHWRPTSPVFRRYALRLVAAMADRFGDNPAVVSWHASNELGCHNVFDYSPSATAAFRQWCRDKYVTLENLNQAWNGAFWSQQITDWEQVIPPYVTVGAGDNPGRLLDFKRFSSDALTDYYRAEADLLHELTPHLPVTTNFMVIQDTNPVDCFKAAEFVDFVSNDHYYLPGPDHLDEMLLSAATVSGIARKNPWFLMENSTASVNWRSVNLRKKPGQIVRDALVHVSNGADAVCFFQWRQSEAGAEQHHSALLPHGGPDTRVFTESCELGDALAHMSEILGSRVEKSPLALVFDYDSWWALETRFVTDELNYRDEVLHWFRAALDAGVIPDVVGINAGWEEYDAVLFPCTYVVDREVSARVRDYVKAGGNVLSTYSSGIVDSDNHVYLGGYPGAFREVLGVRVEEFVPLIPGDNARMNNGWSAEMWADDVSWTADTCETIAAYSSAEDELLMGRPAVTLNHFGDGQAVHIGAKLVSQSAGRLMAELASRWGWDGSGSDAVTRIRRSNGESTYSFLFNRDDVSVRIPVTGQVMLVARGKQDANGIELLESGVAVIKNEER